MNSIYYLVRAAGFFIASLPLFLLYRISDLLGWITAGPVGYRRDVIRENLKNAFPEKSFPERERIRKRFTRFFIDIMTEALKMMSLRKNLIRQRIRISNPELLQSYYEQGKSVIAVGGHYGNWEWLGSGLDRLVPHRALIIYKPLSSRLFDRVMLKTRTRYGSELIPMQDAFRRIRSAKEPVISFLVADQAPHPENAYWTTFLNQDTPVFLGPERIARATGHVVVYLAMQRVRRGYYTVDVQELSADPASEPEFSITEKHVRALERQILQDPSYWLWSHKRWKHKRKTVV